MSANVEKIVNLHNWYHGIGKIKVPKSKNPLRFGVIGAADFTPVGLFDPVRTHPDAVVLAIAARNLAKAQKQADAYGVPRAYGSYDEMLAQPDIDAVYVPLPNGLHAEWAIKAMKAGKHVLIEKPIASNAEEARAIRECARETGLVALEAYHWQFFPAAHVVKSLVEDGKYGDVVSIDVTFTSPVGVFRTDDIRFSYALGGGSVMDFSYVLSATRYFLGGDGKFDVTKATARLNKKDENIDDAMEAELTFHPTNGTAEKDVRCHFKTDLLERKIWGIIPRYWALPTVKIELEQATITFSNFPTAQFYHKITITEKVSGLSQTQKHYSAGPKWGARSQTWWGSYRYQLEAFVSKVRGNENVPCWIDLDESVAVMELIDEVYEKAGLPKRGAK